MACVCVWGGGGLVACALSLRLPASSRFVAGHTPSLLSNSPPPPPPQARELMRIRDYMDGILSEATGQPFDKVC